jgi:predicted Zn-dependent protease
VASHPATSERIDTLAKRAAEMEPQAGASAVGTDTHRAAITTYRAAWLEEELNRGLYADSLVMINQLLKGEPDSAELHYFLGEVYRRRNANGDPERASAAYQAALGAGNAPFAVHRGVGLVALKAGQKEVARDAFEKYLANVPEASDRAMIQFYLTSMDGKQ